MRWRKVGKRATFSDMITFGTMLIDGVGEAVLPRGLKLRLPAVTTVSPERAHLLVEIPWEERYLERVPVVYRKFFEAIRPHLAVRTTDVHTATSAGYVAELLQGYDRQVDEDVVYPALLLHDSGWSRVGQEEIADSLDATGLLHKGTVAGGVEHHDVEGAGICSEVLPSRELPRPLTPAQVAYVTDIVGHHTHGMVMDESGRRRPEMEIVMDADRLWSYSQENFWQDTVRKGVDPVAYLASVEEMLPYYFVTVSGRQLAKRMAGERAQEVSAYQNTVDTMRQSVLS